MPQISDLWHLSPLFPESLLPHVYKENSPFQKLESVNGDVGHDKLSRQRATFAIRDAAVASLRAAYPGLDPSVFYEAFTRLCRDYMVARWR